VSKTKVPPTKECAAHLRPTEGRAITSHPPPKSSRLRQVHFCGDAGTCCQIYLEEEVTQRLVSIERIRVALQRLSVGGQRAKDWISSPDPEYEREKRDVIP
jgi:hypothetical protein